MATESACSEVWSEKSDAGRFDTGTIASTSGAAEVAAWGVAAEMPDGTAAAAARAAAAGATAAGLTAAGVTVPGAVDGLAAGAAEATTAGVMVPGAVDGPGVDVRESDLCHQYTPTAQTRPDNSLGGPDELENKFAFDKLETFTAWPQSAGCILLRFAGCRPTPSCFHVAASDDGQEGTVLTVEDTDGTVEQRVRVGVIGTAL